MARRIDDPKMKVNFRIKQSLQVKIDKISYDFNVPKGVIADLMLEYSLPMFEKIYEKKRGLAQPS